MLEEQELIAEAEKYYRCALLLAPDNSEIRQTLKVLRKDFNSPSANNITPAFLKKSHDSGQIEKSEIIETSFSQELNINGKERKLHIGGTESVAGWEILNAIPGSHVDHIGNAKDLSKFADNTFSALYSSHVLEHFDYAYELEKTLQEWRRVLAPGGTVSYTHLTLPTKRIV